MLTDSLTVCSACFGQLVKFTNTELCECCWAVQQERYSGKDEAVNTLIDR